MRKIPPFSIWIYFRGGFSTYFKLLGRLYRFIRGWKRKIRICFFLWCDQGNLPMERLIFLTGLKESHRYKKLLQLNMLSSSRDFEVLSYCLCTAWSTYHNMKQNFHHVLGQFVTLPLVVIGLYLLRVITIHHHIFRMVGFDSLPSTPPVEGGNFGQARRRSDFTKILSIFLVIFVGFLGLCLKKTEVIQEFAFKEVWNN